MGRRQAIYAPARGVAWWLLAALALAGCPRPAPEDPLDDVRRKVLADERHESAVPEVLFGEQGKAAKAGNTTSSGGSLGVQVGKGTGRGEPVSSTSYAIQLASLVMREQGMTFESRAVLVSYCDGVYSVIFERPVSESGAVDYRVDIDAQTSRVLKVMLKPE